MQPQKTENQEAPLGNRPLGLEGSRGVARLVGRIQMSLANRQRNAFWVACGVALVGLVGVILYLLAALQSGAWQHYGLVGVNGLMLIGGAVGILLTRKGLWRTAAPGVGIWLVLIISQLAFAATVLFVSGMIIWYVSEILLITLFVSTQAMPRKNLLAANVLGVIAAAGALLVNGFLPTFQLPVIRYVAVLVIMLFVALVLLGVLILVAGFNNFALRSKVSITLFAVAAALIVVLTVINNYNMRRELLQAVNQTLLVAANYTSRNLDNYLVALSDDLAVDARNRYLAEYIALPPNERFVPLEAGYFLVNLLEQRGALAYALLDRDGKAVLHTQIQDVTQLPTFLGISELEQSAYNMFLLTGMAFYSSVVFPEDGSEPYFYVGQRVNDEDDEPVGMLVASFPLYDVQEITKESTGLAGEGSHAILLDGNYLRLADDSSNQGLYKFIYPYSTADLEEMRSKGQVPNRAVEELVASIPDFKAGLDHLLATPFFESSDVATEGAVNSMAGVWLVNHNWVVVFTQPQSIILAPVEQQTRVAVVLAGGITLLTVAIALGLAQLLSAPILRLTEVAKQVAQGDLKLRALVESGDEIGTLAQAFNVMTGQLRDMIGGLEQRVAERTLVLEERSQQIQAAAEVGRTAASILDADQLIREVVEYIRNRFGLYYVGLFIVDESSEWAVLRAGTGEAGKAMMGRGHRIRVGQGMVGWCITNQKARVAGEAGTDQVRLATAELPDTQAEAALPLISRNRVVGALTVQSTQVGYFDQATITVLQTMADQVAVALDNARLFAESQSSVEALRRSYGEVSRRAWLEMLRTRQVPGYKSDERGIFPIVDHGMPSTGSAQAGQPGGSRQRGKSTAVESDDQRQQRATLEVPVRLRDQVLGTLRADKTSGEEVWTEEEVALMETLVEQLSIALENARLYEGTQRRAERERILSEITSKVRASTDINAILQIAMQELADALHVSRGAIELRQASVAGGNGDDGDAIG